MLVSLGIAVVARLGVCQESVNMGVSGSKKTDSAAAHDKKMQNSHSLK